MYIGGSINLGVVQEEINSALWEYQVTDTKWSTYPKSISLIIERQWKNQKNFNGKYTPIFYQKSNGNKYKINLESSLQFDLQNNSIAMIRRQNHSETKSLNYNKCPLCLFKISPSAQTCTICSTNIQEYMFKQYNQNNNNNNSNNKNNNNKPHYDDDVKMGDKTQEMIKCPFCQTKNERDFNFCVGCSFDLREYHEKPVPVKDDNNINAGPGNSNDDNKDNSNSVNNNNNNFVNNGNNNNVADDFDPFAEDFDGPDDSDRNKNGMIIMNAQQPGSDNIPPNIGNEGEGGEGDNKNLAFAENWH